MFVATREALRRAVALVAALALFALACAARAQDGTEPIRISFAAPPGCPDELAFTTELRGRTPRARPAWQGEPARTFRITITRHRDTTLGNLTIEEPGGVGSAVREVTGRTCPEVVSALALITALAIDPHASTASRPPALAPTGPGALPHAPWDAGLPSDLAPPSLRLAEPHDSNSAMIPPPLPAWIPRPRLVTPGFRVTTGAQITAHGGVGPALEPGGALFVELGRTERSLLVPTFRVSAMTSAGGAVTTNGARASFKFEAGAVEGCPVQIALERLVRLFPCAAVEVGAIEAQGDSVEFYTKRTEPWISADLLARSQWTFVEHLVLELQGGLAFPLVRSRYLLTSTVIGYDVPQVAGTVGAGLGVRFP
ncbi:MAG TPA: hypothetical protein VGM56_18630 [Byssovorax sp.]|jgi:hypothetical protein